MEESDILFQDEDVCILKPNVTRGILVFRYIDNLSQRNTTTYFKAPFNSDVLTFASSYDGYSPAGLVKAFKTDIEIIRIDPSYTFVYLSPARFDGKDDDYQKTRIPMEKYLNETINKINIGHTYIEHLSGNKVSDNFQKYTIDKRYGYKQLKREFEVKVNMPKIPEEWLFQFDKMSGGFRRYQKKTKKVNRKTRKNKKRKAMRSRRY
jgi:hypothetical protein